jgi:hypothetical protein
VSGWLNVTEVGVTAVTTVPGAMSQPLTNIPMRIPVVDANERMEPPATAAALVVSLTELGGPLASTAKKV